MFSRSEVKVTKWQERDRLHIAIVDRETEQVTILEWWDDDARQMFEDGFFEARRMEQSVLDYATEIGAIK